jgi:ferric-dicitrate binding protein FerR (iron transport regulator)
MDPVRRTRELGQRYLDGVASPAERAELEQLLQGSPAAADAYARLARLDTDLSAHFSEEPGRLREAAVFEAIERHQRRRRWLGRGVRLALAASLLLLAAGPLLWWLGQTDPVVSSAPGHVVLEGEVRVEGQAVERLPVGSAVWVPGPDAALLRLSDGSRARLEPASQVVLHGPSPGVAQRVELIQGEGRFEVVPTDETFLVDTPAGSVTALGTEFTVKLTNPEQGDSEMKRMLLAVIVYTGLVQVEADGTHRLSRGQSRVFGQETRRESDQPTQRTVLGALGEVKDGMLTVATTGGRLKVREVSYKLAAKVQVTRDGKAVKLAEIMKGTMVRLEINDKGEAAGVYAEGPIKGGAVKSVENGKLTLLGQGRDSVVGNDTTYALAENVKVLMGREPAKLADLKAGTRVLLKLSMDEKTVLTINVQRRRGEERSPIAATRATQGVVSAIQDNTLTVVFSVRPIDNEETFDMGPAVRVLVDGKPAKLADLKPGMRVRVVKNDKGELIGIGGEGPTITAAVKTVADGKITLDGRGLDRVCNVTADTKVMIDRRPGKVADLKPGTEIVVTLSVDRRTALTILTVPRAGDSRRLPLVQGQIKTIDAKAGTITLKLMERPGVDKEEERTYTLGQEVKVIIDGKQAGVADLKPGSKATLSLDREGKTVQGIAVRGSSRQRGENNRQGERRE